VLIVAVEFSTIKEDTGRIIRMADRIRRKNNWRADNLVILLRSYPT
jgi:hypothetical protein